MVGKNTMIQQPWNVTDTGELAQALRKTKLFPFCLIIEKSEIT